MPLGARTTDQAAKRVVGRRHEAQAPGRTQCTAQAEHRSNEPTNFLRLGVIGLPNVGKSTLFNAIIKRRKAIVLDQPGVTRDCLFAEFDYNRPVAKASEVAFLEEASKRKSAAYSNVREHSSTEATHPKTTSENFCNRSNDRHFVLIDTPGLDIHCSKTDSLAPLMNEKSIWACKHADLLIFLMDGEEGVSPRQRDCLDAVRALGIPMLLAVNKSESKKRLRDPEDFFSFGLEPIFISAEHGIGLQKLLDEIWNFAENKQAEQSSTEVEIEDGGKIEASGQSCGDTANAQSRGGAARAEQGVAASKTNEPDFMHFSVLTLVPFDARLVDFSQLMPHEKEWLHEYHLCVEKQLACHLNEKEREWLHTYIAPFVCFEDEATQQ
jgi:GTP-binding protein EngB required for normal cell division